MSFFRIKGKPGIEPKTESGRKTVKSRLPWIFAAYFAVLGMVSYGVYADPENPGDTGTSETAEVSTDSASESGSSAAESSQASENPGSDTSETSSDTEASSETASSENASSENASSENASSENSSSEDASASEGATDSTEATEEPTTEIIIPQTIITIVTPAYSAEELLAMEEEYALRQSEKDAAQLKLDELQGKQMDFLANLREMDEMIIGLQTEIDDLEKKQKNLDSTIAQLSYELDRAKEKESEQYEQLKEHIKNAYENGNYSIVDAILSASSFIELLNRPEYVDEVSKYDSKILAEFRESRLSLANKIQLLNALVSGTGTMKDVYADQQAAMQLMTEAKQKEIAKNASVIDLQTLEVNELQKLEQEQADRLAEMQAQNLNVISYSTLAYKGGIFVWPQPSSTYITSDYGYRGDIGIPGASKNHKGIDISARMYDPVVAVAPGTIVYVGYYGTGGKTVMIDVGSSIVAIYHHLNDYAVALGDNVVAGQVVGHVGMTGVTGAPHLHFSVRVNNVYVNPRPYLGLPITPMNGTIIIQDPVTQDTTENTDTTESTEATEQPSTEGTEQPSSENTEQPSSENTEQPSSENTEQPSSENTEQPSSENTEQPSSENTETPSSESPEQPTEAPSQETGTSATEATP